MAKRIVAISALLVLGLLGCQNSDEDGPTSIVLGDSAKMSLRLQVPTNLNIDSGEITITKGDLEYSQSVDLQDGSATVVFNDIQPGIWQIHVALYDADGFMLYEGHEEAEIHGGDTTSAHIVLTELSGDLEVIIDLPPDGDSDPIQWPEAVGGNGHWYEFVEIELPWEVARQTATEMEWMGLSGYLATLTSPEENDFVFYTVVGIDAVWLGGYQDPPESPPADNWFWVTGEPWDWTNWCPQGPMEPNDSGGLESHLCFWGCGEYTDGETWNDWKGWYARRFVVEYGE